MPNIYMQHLARMEIDRKKNGKKTGEFFYTPFYLIYISHGTVLTFVKYITACGLQKSIGMCRYQILTESVQYIRRKSTMTDRLTHIQTDNQMVL